MEIILILFIFVLAAFLGKEIISKVPSQLHTPLMSATNAISGISVAGALVVCAVALQGSLLGSVLAFLAVVFASINVVGGYLVTERMLGMFRKKENKGANSDKNDKIDKSDKIGKSDKSFKGDKN